MLSISDISSFAHGTYAPVAIATISLIVASSFLSIRVIFSVAFRRFWGTFTDEGEDAKAQSAGNQSTPNTTARFAFLAFLILAWPPFFYTIGNLSPLTIIYTSPTIFLEADSHTLGQIACSKKTALDPYSASRLVQIGTSYANEAVASAVEGQVNRAFAVLGIAKSCFVLFIICAAVGVMRKDLRQVSARMTFLSVILIGYLLGASYSSIKNAILNEAFSKIALASAKMSDAERNSINSECIKAFNEKAREITDMTLAVKPSFEWPTLTGLLPLPSDNSK